jgi:hypothetical protein
MKDQAINSMGCPGGGDPLKSVLDLASVSCAVLGSITTAVDVSLLDGTSCDAEMTSR